MTALHRSRLALAAVAIAVGTVPAVAQTPVGLTGTAATSVRTEADALLRQGQRAAASDLLGRWLADHPSDGRAWFLLGRIHFADAQRWHRQGHDGAPDGTLLVEFAGAAFEQAQHLLADSGTVYRVLVAAEQAVMRIEEEGWVAAMVGQAIAADRLPLPPVLAELGQNLIASCPVGGVLVAGSLVETAAVWGARLGSSARDDLMLIRPDLYGWDARYRVRMAEALGVPIDLDLPAALAAASDRRPICLTPAVDSVTTPALAWRPVHLVLTSTPADAPTGSLTVHQLALTGLAGSVWSAAARDVYDLAARRNRGLCQTLLASGDTPGLPSIAACPQ